MTPTLIALALCLHPGRPPAGQLPPPPTPEAVAAQRRTAAFEALMAALDAEIAVMEAQKAESDRYFARSRLIHAEYDRRFKMHDTYKLLRTGAVAANRRAACLVRALTGFRLPVVADGLPFGLTFPPMPPAK